MPASGCAIILRRRDARPRRVGLGARRRRPSAGSASKTAQLCRVRADNSVTASESADSEAGIRRPAQARAGGNGGYLRRGTRKEQAPAREQQGRWHPSISVDAAAAAAGVEGGGALAAWSGRRRAPPPCQGRGAPAPRAAAARPCVRRRAAASPTARKGEF